MPHKKRRLWIDKDEEESIKQKKRRGEDKLLTHEKEKPIDHVIDKEEEKGLPHKKRRLWIDKDEEEPIKQK